MANQFTIYRKDGSVLLAGNGGGAGGGRLEPSLEYSGEWMGECSVTLTVKSPVPVAWAVGDYVEYRGERFVLNYDPTTVKKARRLSHGEAFVYENMRFNALHNELTDVRMLDYVLSDNGVHYSSLPDFTYFCESVEDHADRLQVNCDRYSIQNGLADGEWWVFVTPSLERTLQRCGSNGALRARARELHGQYYGGGGAATDGTRGNQTVSVSDKNVWEACAEIKDTFGYNFITSGRAVVIGGDGIPTGHIFMYGKGNGLYEIERTADQDQQIVTKLFAYGTDKNMPKRYYANLNMRCCSGITASSTEHPEIAYPAITFILTIPVTSGIFRKRTMDERNYLSSITAHGITFPCLVRVVGEAVGDQEHNSQFLNRYAVEVYRGPNLEIPFDYPQVSDELFSTLKSALKDGDTVYFNDYIDRDKWPVSGRDYATDNLPAGMALNVLMLPGFPNQSLYDWVLADGGEAVAGGDDTQGAGLATWRGHTAYFSKDKAQPFILSRHYPTLGIREATRKFDGSDGTEEIYPTIEGTGKDAVVKADQIGDNGIFDDGDDVPTFVITLPGLGDGFPLDELRGDDTVIAMRSGFCGGREFPVKQVRRNADGSWACTADRSHDDLLDLYYPYSYEASMPQLQGNGFTDAYQIAAGDKYMLTGIEMPDAYISLNAARLLEASLTWLEANDCTTYTFLPKVDEIYMAREHDAHGSESLHDTLREGQLMLFEDADLGIDGGVYIETLRIKEYGNAHIPTYEVTLRNDKQVGTIRRMQEQINSIASGGTAVAISNGGGGDGISLSKFRKFLETYGAGLFLSKKSDDTAAGEIGFLKGLWVKAKGLFGIDGEGNAKLGGADISGDASIGGSVTAAGDASVGGDLSVDGTATLRQAIVEGLRSMGFSSGLDGTGYALREVDGKWVLEVDDIIARRKLQATVLEVRRKIYTNGSLNLNQANGTVARVAALDAGLREEGVSVFSMPVAVDGSVVEVLVGLSPDTGEVLGWREAVETLMEDAWAYKLWFLRSSDEVRIRDYWHNGDLAHCQELNVEEHIGGVQRNRAWYRTVLAHGVETLADGREYTYIIVSNAYEPSTETVSGKQAVQVQVADELEGGVVHDDVWSYDDTLPNDVPQVGDDVVQEGSATEAARRGLVTLDSDAEGGGMNVWLNIGGTRTTAQSQFNDRANPIRITPQKTIIRADVIQLSTDADLDKMYTQLEDLKEQLPNVNSEIDVLQGQIKLAVTQKALNDALTDVQTSIRLALEGIESTVSEVDGRVSAVEQTADKFSVKFKDELSAAGFTISQDGKSLLLDGSRIQIQNDLVLKGLVVNSSQSVRGNRGTASWFLTVVDGSSVKSVTVTGERTPGCIPIVCLPMYNAMVIEEDVGYGADDGSYHNVVAPAFREDGAQISISNPYNAQLGGWAGLELRDAPYDFTDDEKKTLLAGAVLVCSDPRLLCIRNFDTAANVDDAHHTDTLDELFMVEHVDGASWHMADGTPTEPYAGIPDFGRRVGIDGNGDHEHGTMVWRGRHARLLLLLPGQTVSLRSAVERHVASSDGEQDDARDYNYLTWYVENAAEFMAVETTAGYRWALPEPAAGEGSTTMYNWVQGSRLDESDGSKYTDAVLFGSKKLEGMSLWLHLTDGSDQWNPCLKLSRDEG